MVKLHIKRGDNSVFLYETTTAIELSELIPEIIRIINMRLRLQRLCDEVSMLAEFGIAKPVEAVGLTDEQVSEMKIKDEWTPKCYPSGGAVYNRDDIGRRTGNAPNDKMAEVLTKTCAEAMAATSKDTVKANKCLTLKDITDEMDKVKGAVMIVYPMGLPPYDEVEHCLNDTENLAGRQAALHVIPEEDGQLWWAGKDMQRSKKLHEYIGKNEKTKLICKIQKKGGGAPVREPVVSEQQQKEMMAYAYKKNEEYKKLEEADDNAYLNAPWADSGALKRSMHGGGNIGWKPR